MSTQHSPVIEKDVLKSSQKYNNWKRKINELDVFFFFYLAEYISIEKLQIDWNFNLK